MIVSPLLILLIPFSHGFRMNFGQQQQQQQQQPNSYEDAVLNNNCPNYLCPDTLTCVRDPQQCPCPFPRSQLKCVLPKSDKYICISKPATHDPKLINLYDDPVKGPKAKTPGLRDCGWVLEMYGN
ncbi:long chronological lifespan protein 2 [Monosporozyma servazzii]